MWAWDRKAEGFQLGLEDHELAVAHVRERLQNLPVDQRARNRDLLGRRCLLDVVAFLRRLRPLGCQHAHDQQQSNMDMGTRKISKLKHPPKL